MISNGNSFNGDSTYCAGKDVTRTFPLWFRLTLPIPQTLASGI